MSWIFGSCGINQNSAFAEQLNKLKDKSLFCYSRSNLQIISGGIKETMFYSDKKNDNGWLACGVGISLAENNAKIFNKSDWELALSKDDFHLNNQDGHFVVIKWINDKINIYTDRLGLRDIYIFKYADGFIFSTRLDWLSKLVVSNLNFSVFGSRWLLFNQISEDSFIDNITRISSGTEATIENGSIIIHKNNWLSGIVNNDIDITKSEEMYRYILERLIELPINLNNSISLSLSGGMDSRVILSFLLKNKLKFDAHTFGNISNLDSIVAKKIVEYFHVDHVQFDELMPQKNVCVDLLKEFTAQTFVNNPASSVLQFRYYNELYRPNNVIIDGGFGEIWRREFFNRLLIQGKGSLLNKNYSKIVSYLSTFRADIFNVDIIDIMQTGCINQIEFIINELPSFDKISVEDWLDLFALKTRSLNYYGHEQSRLDSIVCSYMPFIQPSLVNYLFSIKIGTRKNGKLFRSIINSNCKKLATFPLAKGQITHPYFFNSIESRVWTILMKKIGRYQYDNTADEFLRHIEEFVRDTFNSKDVIECQYYNYNKVKKIIDGFYEGNQSYTSQLDWLLAFELFRQSI
jgi:hypothetical protein